MTRNIISWVVLILAALLAAYLLYPMTEAKADGFHGFFSEAPRRPVRVKYRKRQREEPRYYRRTDDDDNFVMCRAPVRGLGTQYIGENGALDAAKKDWMERVRYDLGEKFLDLSNAKDFTKRCGRTSIGEALGQVLYRCEIIAKPCRAPYVLLDGER